MATGCETLTEKEKQALRLLVRGHDAKSTARHLGLSVHTVNERLRDARRKLAVSSSREAARRLLDHEGEAEPLADKDLREAAPTVAMAAINAPPNGRGRPRRSVTLLAGVSIMSFAFALLAFIAEPHPPSAVPPTVTAEPADTTVEAAARNWLALVDQSRWAESWAGTTASFQSLNTVQAWTAASEQARVPLGAMRSRTLLSQDDVPAPPHGYRVIKFRTDFANRQGVTETVSLDREGGQWRVVGIYLG